MLVLNDGSLFRIAPKSAVVVEDVAGKQTVRVVEGTLGVAKTTPTTAVVSRNGAGIVSEPATVDSSMIRMELPAPSRRR